jgi:hypothetical protein
VHTRDTRSALSEGIQSEARREVFGSGDGSEVQKNGVTGNGNKRRLSTDRCGPREFGAGEVGGQTTDVLRNRLRFRPEGLLKTRRVFMPCPP